LNNDISIQDFIYSPDTVDFVVRQDEYLADYINKNPDILLTQVLSGGYVIGYANVNIFNDILTRFGQSIFSSLPIVLGTLDRLSLDAAGITQTHELAYNNLKGRGVLVGIVDTGVDYTQDIFRYGDGTSKIQFIFDQSVSGVPPEGFYYGTEYTNVQINEAFNAENPYDIVPQQDTSGHGTFLASIAAGREIGDFEGAAPDAELIVVKLKKARPFYLDLYSVPAEQENAFESSDIMVGVQYILEKARKLGRPVAICIGLGSNLGSHDGSMLIAEYFSYVSKIKGVCICIAAGNESQARHHMQGFISVKGETADVDVTVGSDAGNVDISIWNKAVDRFSVSVRSPAGESFGRFFPLPGQINEARTILEKTGVRVVYYFPTEGAGNQLTRVRLIDATPGVWTIKVTGDIVLIGSFHAWLPLTGFVSPNVEFLSASPYHTITVPAPFIGSICCGAYDSRNNNLYYNSSWGPTLIPTMSPDLVAPGVDVGGFYPGGYGTMTGTSVAAAIITGACALFLQWGIIDGNDVSLSTNQIRTYLIRGCNRNDFDTYPNYKWGYGSLNVLKSFRLIRGI